MYSGFDAATKVYDKSTWNYQEGGDMYRQAGRAPIPRRSHALSRHRRQASRRHLPPPPALPPNVAYDLTLQHPRCVFQLLKKQYSRYTPEMVERITGIPKGPVPESGRPVHVHPQRRRHEEGRRPSSTRLAGRSTPSARRSSAPPPCFNCSSGTSGAPAAA